jgi:2-oxo-4-hydroxy-4-carboxy-5-ureidoimidazoline decarboxylase
MTLSEVNALDRDEFTGQLGHLFEHSPWVAQETWPQRPFKDVEQLHAALCRTMRDAPMKRQKALIEAHPDLGGRLALAGKLTAASTQEQAKAGLDQMTEAESQQFQKLNAAYREKFGIPFVICARLNARPVILSALGSRLSNGPVEEHETALDEIQKIAWLRLSDLVTSDH